VAEGMGESQQEAHAATLRHALSQIGQATEQNIKPRGRPLNMVLIGPKKSGKTSLVRTWFVLFVPTKQNRLMTHMLSAASLPRFGAMQPLTRRRDRYQLPPYHDACLSAGDGQGTIATKAYQVAPGIAVHETRFGSTPTCLN
jgi:hypothetical protein